MTPMTHMLFTWTGQQLGISNLKKGFFVRMVKPELQGSHRSGKSGNSGKILKTFSSQGNQGKTGFSAKIREKNFKSGNFFPNHFQTF